MDKANVSQAVISGLALHAPGPANRGASGRARWQSCSSAASIGLHPRQRRGIQAIPNKKLPLKTNNPKYPPTDEYYYYSATDTMLAKDYESLNDKEKNRFFPLICGFNPTDKLAYKQIERVIKYFPNRWHGIGEVLFRHGSQTRHIPGELPRLNHPAMENVYRLCADRKMPILIHQNLNSDESSPNPEAMQELEETLDKQKKTIFILSHCGTAQKIYNPNHHEVMRELLSYHDNLCVDLSWKIFDKYIYRAGNLDENWVKLAQDFSERICLGSDDTENPEEIPQIMAKFDILLDSLDKKTQINLTHQTAYRLYNEVRV
ncbi:MAG: amidohydrolase family protein [Candidatus Berkelbacteria bacterium]|nr:amidohydrolase family protein [Candidatus Berkelbacteria bacterium]